MRVLFVVVLCNVLPIIWAHLDILNKDLGDLHLQATIGTLPKMYYPMTEKDHSATEKAANVFDFVQLVPFIDPLHVKAIYPVGIDLPFLWFSGKVFMKNFTLAGVKQFVLRNVVLRINNLRADLSLSLPQITFEGEFNLQADLSFLPVTLRCYISAKLMELEINVSAGGKIANVSPTGQVLQVESAEVRVDIKNIVFNITNIDIGGYEEEVGPPIAQLFTGPYRKNFLNGLLKTALGMVNTALEKMPLDFFKTFLLPEY